MRNVLSMTLDPQTHHYHPRLQMLKLELHFWQA
jgi:hypothetical protein